MNVYMKTKHHRQKGAMKCRRVVVSKNCFVSHLKGKHTTTKKKKREKYQDRKSIKLPWFKQRPSHRHWSSFSIFLYNIFMIRN